MRVLLVTQAFPPFNASGCLRVGRLAEHLLAAGHDLRVLTATPLPYPATLPVRIPDERVIRTRSMDPFAWLAARRRRAGGDAAPSQSLIGEGQRGRLLRNIGAVLAVPEPQAGWYFPAVAAGRKLCRSWHPEVIYASALPFTAHTVAARLSRDADAPWVGEFRDLFAGNPYSNLPRWRNPIDLAVERRVLASASALVTVSEPMAETLRTRHGKRTVVVLNGFDEYRVGPEREGGTAAAERTPRVRILYTGVIYPGRRDPSALFAAIASLGPEREFVQVDFFGQDLRGVEQLAARYGVTAQVQVHAAIPYAAALAEQERSDVLLLLLWNDPREAGVYTGKLFEYVGAARPVLAIGSAVGVAPDLIRSRALGVVAASTEEVGTALRRWIAEKRQTGVVRRPAASAAVGLSRREQFAIILKLLHELSGSASSVTG